jgi:hypothetical protein
MPMGSAMAQAMDQRTDGEEEGWLGALIERCSDTGMLRKIDWPRSPFSSLADIEKILRRQRLIEPKARPALRDVGCRRIGPEHDRGRIAWVLRARS